MVYFFIAFGIALVGSLGVRVLAARWGILDRPDGGRKRHFAPTPLGGGVAIFVAVWATLGYLILVQPIRGIELLAGKLWPAFLGSTIVLLIGLADDFRPFSARARLALTSGAVLATIAAGFSLDRVTNPFGGFIILSAALGNLVVFLWLMGMMYTTKILDGLDGLSVGIVGIGALLMYLLTTTSRFYQPNVGLVSLVLLGASLGFLVLNFYPARLYLGESGGLFLGFMLGVLAIIGGGKLATALLVMAIPILDLIRVIYQRRRQGRPVFTGDREHLHFRLLDWGWSQRQAVLFFYVVAAGFGVLTLWLQSYQKLLALAVLGIGMLAFSIWLTHNKRMSNPRT